MLSFSGTAPPLTSADIADFEQRYAISLPSEFREHYLKFNGGQPDSYRFIDDNDALLIVNEFLPIQHGPRSCTLEATLWRMKIDQPLLPENLVPFAVDPGGAFFCFSTCDKDCGQIYFVQMDGDPKLGSDSMCVASSLNEFLSKLHKST
jgi:cell wall assembly regulator SMI1